MQESDLERKLVKETKKRGGLALKLISPGFAGMPDRILLFRDGKIAFVEVKSPGQKPRALQRKRHDKLRHLGFKVYVLDDVVQIEKILKDVG